MKPSTLVVGLCVLASIGIASAQEHYTEGPVWSCSSYRTKQGHTDDYLLYLRTHYLATTAESKKQGLTLDSKIFMQQPASPADWDIMICTLFPSYGKAMDYNAADEEKSKAIQGKHWGTMDEKKQDEMAAQRYAFRDLVGTKIVREVMLKPAP